MPQFNNLLSNQRNDGFEPAPYLFREGFFHLTKYSEPVLKAAFVQNSYQTGNIEYYSRFHAFTEVTIFFKHG